MGIESSLIADNGGRTTWADTGLLYSPVLSVRHTRFATDKVSTDRRTKCPFEAKTVDLLSVKGGGQSVRLPAESSLKSDELVWDKTECDRLAEQDVQTYGQGKRRWGRWYLSSGHCPSLDTRVWFPEVDGYPARFVEVYDIELAQCRTETQRAGWIRHMKEKRWLSSRGLADLERAFDDLIRDGTIVSSGVGNETGTILAPVQPRGKRDSRVNTAD